MRAAVQQQLVIVRPALRQAVYVRGRPRDVAKLTLA